MQRFQSRTALVDEHVVGFLKIVTELGGYCTLEQAKALELANSNTRVSAYLKGLERAGFVRRVAEYPVVYQITGATTRLLNRDRHARRAHDAVRVLSRLLAVSFISKRASGQPTSPSIINAKSICSSMRGAR